MGLNILFHEQFFNIVVSAAGQHTGLTKFVESGHLGSARVSRADASPARTFGVSPKQSFLKLCKQ
jgi:hypothetical protein